MLAKRNSTHIERQERISQIIKRASADSLPSSAGAVEKANAMAFAQLKKNISMKLLDCSSARRIARRQLFSCPSSPERQSKSYPKIKIPRRSSVCEQESTDADSDSAPKTRNVQIMKNSSLISVRSPPKAADRNSVCGTAHEAKAPFVTPRKMTGKLNDHLS